MIKWQMLLRTQEKNRKQHRKRLKVVLWVAYGMLLQDKPKTSLWERCRAKQKVCLVSSPNSSRTRPGVRSRLGQTELSMPA